MKRAARSFAAAIAFFSNVRLLLYVHPDYSFPDPDVTQLEARGASIQQVFSLADAIAQSDVIYHAGLTTEAQIQMTEDFTLTVRALAGCSEKLIILHPMPRLGSISVDVDHLPQAKYIQNGRNGVFVRMALLSRALGICLT